MQIKGPGKRGHIVADTLLPTQMFPRLPSRATFVADTNFVSGTQKMFLILCRNILCPQQMFPSLRSRRNILGNNVSAFTRAFRIVELTVNWPALAVPNDNEVFSQSSYKERYKLVPWETCGKEKKQGAWSHERVLWRWLIEEFLRFHFINCLIKKPPIYEKCQIFHLI